MPPLFNVFLSNDFLRSPPQRGEAMALRSPSSFHVIKCLSRVIALREHHLHFSCDAAFFLSRKAVSDAITQEVTLRR